MRSLRGRLLLGTALGTAVVLLVSGIALHAMTRAWLYSDFDALLRAKAETLSKLIEQEGDRIELEFVEADVAEFRRPQRPECFEVWRSDGSVVARSPSLGGTDLPRVGEEGERGAVGPVVLPGNRPGRVATLRFTARSEREVETQGGSTEIVLSFARDVLDVEATMSKLRLGLSIVGSIATAVSVCVLALLVQHGLEPAKRLARQIEQIDVGRLVTRLDPAATPSEFCPVVERLNGLLARLDDAFGREKTMTANVAHELRTPLAGLRATLEVSLLRDREAADYRKAAESCLEICNQAQKLIENLLAMARLDAGGVALRSGRIDLERLLARTWTRFETAAHDKRVTVNWAVEPELSTDGDEDKVGVVLGNVLENAVEYVDDGGTVAISAGQDNGAVRICVSNTGSRVGEEDVARVFDRFWRGDAARQQGGGHSGLGLALSKLCVERLGGEIAARSSDGGMFEVALKLGLDTRRAGPGEESCRTG